MYALYVTHTGCMLHIGAQCYIYGCICYINGLCVKYTVCYIYGLYVTYTGCMLYTGFMLHIRALCYIYLDLDLVALFNEGDI